MQPTKRQNTPLKVSVIIIGIILTIAGLYVALSLLGIGAVFYLPKVWSSQTNTSTYNKENMKEDTAAMAAAFSMAQMEGKANANTRPLDLISYVNYKSIATSGKLVDAPPNDKVIPCSQSAPCLTLYNNSTIQLLPESFSGTEPTNAIQFRVDTNGKFDGDSSSSAMQFEIYYDGQITSRGQAKPHSCNSGQCPFEPDPQYDPAWFSWD